MSKGKTHLTFYQKVDYPEIWLLPDVLYWIAFNRVPLCLYTNDGIEVRGSTELYCDGNDDLLESITGPLTEKETTSRDLPPDPYWAESELDQNELPIYSLPSQYDEHLELMSGQISEEKRKLIVQNKTLAHEQQKTVNIFNEKLGDYLDLYYSELHLKLRTGELNGRGIKVENGDYELVIERFFEKIGNNNTIQASAVEGIPSKYWILKNIRWRTGELSYQEYFFCHLHFNASDVLSVFPPTVSRTFSAQKCGDSILQMEPLDQPMQKRRRMGRPQKNWDALHVRIAQIAAKNGELPKKQDALAQELADWYFSEFGEKIGLSTVRAKLKNYYAR